MKGPGRVARGRRFGIATSCPDDSTGRQAAIRVGVTSNIILPYHLISITAMPLDFSSTVKPHRISLASTSNARVRYRTSKARVGHHV